MSAGVIALLIVVPVALLLGFAWQARQGKVRRSTSEEIVTDKFPDGLKQRLAEAPEPDAKVTLLQLSTTFCQPCRHARILLADFAGKNDQVRHVEVDLTDHPEWSTPLGVHTTPTTLILDREGHELFRIGGVPRPQALSEAIAPHVS